MDTASAYLWKPLKLCLHHSQKSQSSSSHWPTRVVYQNVWTLGSNTTFPLWVSPFFQIISNRTIIPCRWSPEDQPQWCLRLQSWPPGYEEPMEPMMPWLSRRAYRLQIGGAKWFGVSMTRNLADNKQFHGTCSHLFQVYIINQGMNIHNKQLFWLRKRGETHTRLP